MVFCALGISSALAQKTFSGTVIGPDGLGLPGVSVIEKANPTNGVYTNIDGKWTLTVPNGKSVLEFSSVGFKTIVIAAKNAANLTMKDDAQLLDNVVVVGYGKAAKNAFTGTAKVVGSEKITAKAVSNVSQALAGESAGVQVVKTGKPGQEATIRIRGFGTVNGSSNPLFVVDGIPYEGDLNSINPEDVKSSTILKDASATAIYGSRGANGVVLITTKKGRAGKTNFEVNFKTGVNLRLLPRYERVTSPEEYIEMSYAALRNSKEKRGVVNPANAALNEIFGEKGINPIYNMWNANGNELIDISTGKFKEGITRKYTPEDWGDYAFQTSTRNEANLKMSGGTEKTSHYISLGYLKDVGYALNSDYSRLNGRMNLSYKPTKWLKANTNVDYSYGETNAGTGGGAETLFWIVDNIPSIYPLFLRDKDGNIVKDKYYGNNKFDYGLETGRAASQLSNGVGTATYDLDRTQRHSFNTTMSFVADITKGLTFETNYGFNFYSSIRANVGNPFFGGDSGSGGALSKTFSTFTAQNANQILRYSTSFDEHTLEGFIAHETNETKYDFSTASKKGVVNLASDDARTSLSNYISQNGDSGGYYLTKALESYFGQVSYNYDNKYFISGTVRRDGSSRFANNKWGTFWSVGGAWILSKEKFMESVKYVDLLKLKLSYGVLGDERGIQSGGYDVYYAGVNGYDIDNLDGKMALQLRATVDPNITWETSNQFQTGVEFELFNRRLEGSLDYYRKVTTNLFFTKRLSPSTGDAILQVNDGSLLNAGVEFDLTGHIIKTDDFKFSASLNGEFLHNELLEMPMDNATGKRKIIDAGGTTGLSEGRSLYDYYMPEWAGVDAANGNPLWIQYWVDGDGNGVYDDKEGIIDYATYIVEHPDADIKKRVTSTYTDATNKYLDKSAIPTVRGAFRLNFEYKGITLGTQFAYSIGGYLYDSAYAGLMGNGQLGQSSYLTDMRESWKKPGDITNVPRLYTNENIRVNATSSRFLTKADYLALNNVRLGYSLPKIFVDKIGLKGVDLWVTGDNLFLLSERKGFNPMSSSLRGSSDSYRYEPMSSFTFGARIKF